jgi:hypothetical protein
MILNPCEYEPDPEITAVRPRLAVDDIHSLEVQADHMQALKIIKEIMRIHDLTPESIRDELSIGGVDWAKAGEAQIDLSALFEIDFSDDVAI